MFTNFRYLASNEGSIEWNCFASSLTTDALQIEAKATSLNTVFTDYYTKVNNVILMDTNIAFAFLEYGRYIFEEGPNKRAYALEELKPGMASVFPWLVKMGQVDNVSSYFIAGAIDIAKKRYLKLNVEHVIKPSVYVIFSSETFDIYTSDSFKTTIDKLPANIFLYFSASKFKAPPKSIRLPRDDCSKKNGDDDENYYDADKCIVCPTLEDTLNWEAAHWKATEIYGRNLITDRVHLRAHMIIYFLRVYFESIKVSFANLDSLKEWLKRFVEWQGEMNSALPQLPNTEKVLKSINNSGKQIWVETTKTIKDFEYDCYFALKYLNEVINLILTSLKNF